MVAHDAWYGKTDDGHLLELRWDTTQGGCSRNRGGMTGWACVLRSSGGNVRDGACHRVHKCSTNPCSARWPSSKYGMLPPPMHLQEVSASETSFGPLQEVEAAAPLQEEFRSGGESSAVAGSRSGGESSAVAGTVENSAVADEEALQEVNGPEVTNSIPLQEVEAAAPLQEVDAAVPMQEVNGPEIPSSVPLRSGHIPTAVSMSPSRPQLRMGCPQLRRDCAAVSEASLFMESEHKVFQKIVELARSIRSPRTYVGYTFFVLLGICKNCQPVMWEGSGRVNLLEKYAPWALPSAVADCAVDAVVCCMRSLPTGRAELLQVSEDQPLADCRHFVACHKMTTSLQCEGDSIEAFYGRLGIVLLSTAMDGDCGVDTACRMLGLPTIASCREELRREIADYLLERHDTLWMHQLLAVCEELPMEDVERIRSGGGSSAVAGFRSGGESSAAAEGDSQANASSGGESSAVADEECRIVVGHEMEAVETVEALKWATRIVDNGILLGLLHSLPSWVLKQQVLDYRGRACAPTHAPPPPSRKINVDPKSLSVRDAVAQAFEEYLRSCGAVSTERLPRGQVKAFVDLRLEWSCKWWSQPERSVRRWHRSWTLAGKVATVPRSRQNRIVYGGALPQSRKRRFGAGRLAMCNFVREGLFEWFVSMRYSIDWRKYNSSFRSVGRFKAIGRFPVTVLRDKAKQLLQ